MGKFLGYKVEMGTPELRMLQHVDGKRYDGSQYLST